MSEVILDDSVTIPGWVVDHDSFRRWAHSKDFPEQGRFSFIRGRVWVDWSMERDVHNQIKHRVGMTLTDLSDRKQLGRYWTDGMSLSNLIVGLSTEPDGMFATWESLRSERAQLAGGEPPNAIEVEGSPDMVLEVVSRSSVRKDTVELPDLYWQAGITEYWLIDPRGNDLRFHLFRHTEKGFRAVRPTGGWRKSAVFGASFRLVQSTDPLGHPAYALKVR